MANNYGTLSLADTLAVEDADNIYVREYGEDQLFAYADAVLQAHNTMVEDMVGDLVEFTNKRISRYGNDVDVDMVEVDEFGVADAQKAAVTGNDIGWPLRAFQATVQWTRLYFEQKTLQEFTEQFDAILSGDVRNIERALKRALFTGTNATFIDRRIDSISIPVKALVNADGAQIPRDKFGNTFNGATHTHYLGTASLADADVQSAVDTVIEHGVSGTVLIYCNQAEEADIRAMASFDAFQQAMIVPGANTDRVLGGPERYFETDNRPIGVWDGAIVVWVKPWVPAGYVLVIEVGGDQKPLRFRTRRGAGRGNLAIQFEDEAYPLRARMVEREFGVGVWGRTKAAILDTANATYTAPTIT